MKRKTVFVLTILFLILLDGWCFAPGLGGVSLSGFNASTLMAVGLILLSIAGITLASLYAFSSDRPNMPEIQSMPPKERPDYEAKIKSLPECFDSQKQELLADLKAYTSKSASIRQLITESLGASSISSAKYTSTLDSLSEAFYGTLEQIIRRMELFNQEDYLHLKKENDVSRLRPYEDMLEGIQKKLEQLDAMIVLLDRLLLGLLDMEDPGNSASLRELEDMESLIQETRFYQKVS